ncbi:MAG: MBL fold metallo-hydrolase [Acidimicrobiales bacterium]
MVEPTLTQLAQGVYAWLDPRPGPGRPNAGAVIDADGVTVIDTLCVPSQFVPFGDAVDALGFPIRRIALTGDHIEYVGGTVRFTMAAVFGSPATSAHLDQPPQPEILRRLFPDQAPELDDDLRTRPVSHVVAEPVQLTPALFALPLAGQAPTNLVLLVPDADVLFAGALCSFGVTPLAFDGDPAAWADTLDDLGTAAGTIVPGHGPVGGPDEVAELQGYLRACVAADGDPHAIGPGPWDAWPGRHADVINVERAALLRSGDQGVPPSMLRLAGLVDD